MRKSIIAILSLVAMVACTNDVTVKTQAPAAITFEDSFVEVKTRAAVDPSITTATIDAFDVWGFMDDPKGLMFDAQRVTKGEAGWTYNPLQYWTQDHNYFFYAVAPVDNADIVVNTDLNIEGLGTIDFTNTDGSVDLLYAEKQESTFNEDVNADGHETVKLTFAHLLSKVKFTFTNGFPEGTSSLKIENIKISQAPSKGTVTLNDDTAGRTWKITDSNATLDFGHVNGGVALLPNESAECDNERLTIPADANVRYQIDFTATLYYGENVALTSEKTVYLEDQAFVIGKNYNITATIDNTNIAEDALTPIIFDVVEVEDWELGEHNGKIDFENDGTQVNPDAPTALATPVVTAVAKENTVTLSWEAVENAASYSITVGTEMPVVTEELTYTFTGEYETEYTFNVVAIPADEEKFAASEAGVATATTEAAPAVTPETKSISVAEFLAMPEDEAEGAATYRLTGVITRVANTTYGNFDLTDETGTVYIYGLCSPEGAQKYWAESGAKLGDTITVETVRTSYAGSPQGKNAIFVELVPFVETASEWGIVGDLTGWADGSDIVMYNTWKAENLFVAYNVEIASGAFKIRANNEWNDAKNYGLAAAGKIYADKYYALLNGGGSQNATPMVYGTYDVYFDLANERVALVTPGKEYADAVDGGDPVVVIEGLKEHTWGLIGSFAGSDWNADVAMEVVGDWAVAKNVTLANGNEFKFRADGAWTLSYGAGCDVNVGETYTTYNNGQNMKFVGEDGAYNIYFSLVDAKFYMETYISATTVEATMANLGFANAALVETITLDENVTLTFEKGGASTAPAYYNSGEAVRLYQNGAIMNVSANGRTISSIEITFANNMYYVAADSGELSEEAAVRTWTGSAESVKFTCTGTTSSTRAYIKAIKVTYE